MYVDYSATYERETALQLIFSGEKPCELCHAVADFEASGKELPELALGFAGWGLLPPTFQSVSVERPQERRWLYLDFITSPRNWDKRPHTPPPKVS